MSFQPNWRGRTGWFPISAVATCIHCKEPLRKLHGLNKNRPDEQPTVMALFLFGVGAFCVHCGKKAWLDGEFFNRSGSNDYSANRYDLERDFRARFPTAEQEYRSR